MGMPWGLRTAHYKYVEYLNGYKQLFDLQVDPNEMHNLGADPAYEATRQALHDRIVELGGGATLYPSP
jgi:hypothetical protein